MSNDDKLTPVEVRAPRGARQMEIDWADGHRSLLPHAVLRGYCPCAHCQGHEGPITYTPQDESTGALELVDLEEVGNYALRLAWGDGHGTGIYSFRFLRELCACGQCDPTPSETRIFPR